MTELSYLQLDQACQLVAAGSPHYSSFIADGFQVLYATGCRPIEMLDSSRWINKGGKVLTLQPAKGNNIRTLDGTGLPASFIKFVDGDSSSFSLVTYYKCANLFNHLWPFPQCFIGQKQVDQYCFRHRYVKSLALAGYTTLEIQQALGWTTSQMVDRYLGSVIYYN